MNASPTCPSCGAPLASRTTPDGLCARCLMGAARESGGSQAESLPARGDMKWSIDVDPTDVF